MAAERLFSGESPAVVVKSFAVMANWPGAYDLGRPTVGQSVCVCPTAYFDQKFAVFCGCADTN